MRIGVIGVIGVIGAGHIGGNCARQAVKAGHEVKLAFARDPAKLEELASELGDRASRCIHNLTRLVYGEEYRAADAQSVVDAVHDSYPIPPTPRYG